MGSIWHLAPLLLAIATTSACDRVATSETSGSYMASDASSAFKLRLSKGEGDHVSGTFDLISVGTTGKVSATAMPVTGTAEGNTLDLIGQVGTGMFAATTSISGKRSGDDLNLTIIGNGNSVPLSLHRKSPSEWPDTLARLTKYSIKVRADLNSAKVAQAQGRARADALEATDSLAARLDEMKITLRDYVNTIDEAAARYPAMKIQLRALRQQAAMLNRSEEGSIDHFGTLRDSANDISNEAGELHRVAIDLASSVARQRNSFLANFEKQMAACLQFENLTCERLRASFSNYKTADLVLQTAAKSEASAFVLKAK